MAEPLGKITQKKCVSVCGGGVAGPFFVTSLPFIFHFNLNFSEGVNNF